MRGMVRAWKCYRCNLYFKYETHAHMHRGVMNHSVARIKLVAA